MTEPLGQDDVYTIFALPMVGRTDKGLIITTDITMGQTGER